MFVIRALAALVLLASSLTSVLSVEAADVGPVFDGEVPRLCPSAISGLRADAAMRHAVVAAFPQGLRIGADVRDPEKACVSPVNLLDFSDRLVLLMASDGVGPEGACCGTKLSASILGRTPDDHLSLVASERSFITIGDGLHLGDASFSPRQRLLYLPIMGSAANRVTQTDLYYSVKNDRFVQVGPRAGVAHMFHDATADRDYQASVTLGDGYVDVTYSDLTGIVALTTSVRWALDSLHDKPLRGQLPGSPGGQAVNPVQHPNEFFSDPTIFSTQEFPVLDVNALCQHASSSTLGMNQCILSQQQGYDEARSCWDVLPDSSKSYCKRASALSRLPYSILGPCVVNECDKIEMMKPKTFKY